MRKKPFVIEHKFIITKFEELFVCLPKAQNMLGENSLQIVILQNRPIWPKELKQDQTGSKLVSYLVF